MRITIKNLIKASILFLFISLSACDKSEPEILCTTPPEGFRFEITDKTTGENLFTNGTFKSDQIVITDKTTNTKVPYTFISENNINLISINSIGWKTEKVDYSITIQEKAIFELYVDASRLNGMHCSYTEFNQVLIKNTAYEWNKDKGVYIIEVP